ncbi:MAG TPA: hypothetical protein VGO37_20485, partial [Steroidobacteraceae bacterium]|nr:hypothetical protein [Steroidobacteraceae bacterium]
MVLMRNSTDKKRITPNRLLVAAQFAVLAGIISFSSAAQALPSFARQTGKPCAQCHTVAYGPALTSYGRQFKLNGYVWGDVTP